MNYFAFLRCPGPANKQAALHWLLNVALGVAGLALITFWLGRILAPGPVLAQPSEPALDTASALKLFAAPQAATRLEGVRLTGVYANNTGGGFASFATVTGPVAVPVGGEVVPGVALRAVEARLAVLDDRGREVRLELPDVASTPIQEGMQP